MSFEINNLDKWTEKLDNLQARFPIEIENFMIDVAKKLYKELKERTPVDNNAKEKSNDLKESWKVGNLVRNGDKYYIEIFTKVKDATNVEYGYRKPQEKGKSPDDKSIVYIPGYHMVKISVEELNKQLPSYFQKWIKNNGGIM
ncbi:bacteriophage HK97-gp10, putative tail-component [Gottschalkia purinilytica]|uniref:Bacteriophage HK97-gp10, putative tail-component n=1 Tax=Gottschalkia purinilytica TaxID=1503 RepID=A0A0L0WF56_GOTPU|nr:HK97 gp10 family phage protein [Gottschalkia purinilytica]KNF10061.1 bacteriophage HK97-gp10, putative tail-component [Gottschalkia purinilytica]